MRKIVVFLFSIALLACSLWIGVKELPLNVWQWQPEQSFIFWTTRVPRTLSLCLAGSILSVTGLLMQQLTQNKFVSPQTAGTMDSARLGMIVVMLLFPGAPVLVRASIAFVFAFLGTLLFLLCVRWLRIKNPVMIPLIGLMFGNIIGAVATFFAYQFQLIQNMSSWLQGNFSTIMKGNYELLLFTIPLFFLTYMFAYRFTILGMGEEMATNLGVRYQQWQWIGLAIVALASAFLLVMVGNIPFIGIIIPNLVSLYYGDQMRDILAKTAFYGSVFLLLCDIVARLVIAPYEMPVSVVVSVIGSVVFIGLLMRRATG